MRAAVDSGPLTATTDFGALDHRDAVCVCVPTPLKKTRGPRNATAAEIQLTLLGHVAICLAPVENRLNGNDASLSVVPIDHPPITDSKSRQVARPP